LDANTVASSSSPARRTLTAKRRDRRTISSVRDRVSKHTIISSGSSDSEVTALVVMPPGPSGPIAVTIATPVGNRPIVSRNARAGPACTCCSARLVTSAP
jgi:hypothetical protein